MRFVLLVVIAAGLTGCASDGQRGHDLPRQPEHVIPTKMGLSVKYPEDTNSNGYLDTIEIFLWVSSETHYATLDLPGTFQFRLVGKDHKDIAKWTFDEPLTLAARYRAPFGPAYHFKLSVLDSGTDEIEAQATDLEAVFTPSEGKPVRAPLTALRFGRIRT